MIGRMRTIGREHSGDAAWPCSSRACMAECKDERLCSRELVSQFVARHTRVPYHDCTIIAPSLYRHCTITVTITVPLLSHHCPMRRVPVTCMCADSTSRYPSLDASAAYSLATNAPYSKSAARSPKRFMKRPGKSSTQRERWYCANTALEGHHAEVCVEGGAGGGGLPQSLRRWARFFLFDSAASFSWHWQGGRGTHT